MPQIHPSPAAEVRHKVRRLTLVSLFAWLMVTLLPVLLAGQDLHIGPWPLDFWMAAQGSVLSYVLIVVIHAWMVNRWERQSGELSFELPPAQES